tara:strand:- start:504 stop:782 length:279 start_codon:yes stop_codon:yes gene_type:complete
MKVFFSYQGIQNQHFLSFDVSSSLTVAELVEFEEIKKIISLIDHKYELAVNSEVLDGNFKPLPSKYRLREGERVEILRPLVQDPKERRLNKV